MSTRSRAIRRRATRLLGYWRAEQRTLRQGLVALALSTLAGFVAGLTLASITGTLEELPGLIVLIPAAVGMRGTIFGAIGARLGTANAAGTLEITAARDGVLGRNARVALLTTLSSSLWLAVLARMATAAFGHASISLLDLVTISVVGGLLGSILILAVTIGLSVLSYRRGWDLDSVATPMVTALGDMATLPTLFLATFLVRNDVVALVVGLACVAAGVIAAVRSYTVDDGVVRRIALQMTAVILLTPVLDIVAGTLLRAREPELIAVPAVLALIPPFVSQAGALGGILSSRVTSKLQIGVVTPRGVPEVPAFVDASLVFALGVVVFALIGAVAVGLAMLTGDAPDQPLAVIGGAVLSGLLILPVTIALSYELAIASYRFGLDPDDQTVPVITSVMDLLGVAVVLFVMTSSGVLPHG